MKDDPVMIDAQELIDETQVLEQLTDLLTRARQVRPDRPPLVEILDAQAKLCADLSERRAARAERLQAAGYHPRDLLVAVLAGTPKTEHERTIQTFGAYISAAERAQTQIDVNREFFAVALSAVEDALLSAAPDGKPATYERPGVKRKSAGSVIVSTTT